VILLNRYYLTLTFRKRIVICYRPKLLEWLHIFIIGYQSEKSQLQLHLVNGKKPEITHLRVFGATAFVRIPDSMRRKVDPKAKKTIFVGYDRYTDKVYQVFDLKRKIVERIADVTIEDVMNTNEQILFPLIFEEQEASTKLLEQEDSFEDLSRKDETLTKSSIWTKEK